MPMFEEISGIQYGSGIKAVLYGQEGVGKSSLAAKIPGIIFIDCEGSTTKMDVRRLPVPTSWAMLCDEMEFVLQNAAVKGYRAVAIDTFDWAEMLVLQAICAESNVKSIEGIPYGKGWQIECEKVARFLESTDRLIKAGIHVILICHAVTRKTTLPEELDEFDHWELKLGNKTTNKIAPLLKEWSDMTLFLAFKTQVMAADDKGKTHKATSVQRVMYATKSAWWDAKNRFGLPDMMPLDYGAIAHLFAAPADNLMQRAQDAGIPTATINVPQSAPVNPVPQVTQQSMAQQAAPVNSAPKALTVEDLKGAEPIETIGTEWNGIPDALRNLMQSNKVLPAHIQKITGPEVRHYFPADMPVGNYPQDYHEWLIANWQEVMNDVRANCPDYVPF
ncbi:MAG: ATP-binding protein [Oscillospiraceae bacterium]|nr:ATP-binding protein [Oscillospiraceae bacterium]